MDVKINVKRKFKVNGKEYNSIEEMPAPIREAYEKAVSEKGGTHHESISSISSGKIIVNGQEYESVDSMPADIRQMYETIMKSVKSGENSITANPGLSIGEKAADFRNEGALDSYSLSKPITPKSFFSPRVFIVVAAILVLLMGIYFLLIIGSR